MVSLTLAGVVCVHFLFEIFSSLRTEHSCQARGELGKSVCASLASLESRAAVHLPERSPPP